MVSETAPKFQCKTCFQPFTTLADTFRHMIDVHNIHPYKFDLFKKEE